MRKRRVPVVLLVVAGVVLLAASLVAYSHGQPIRVSRDRIVEIRLQPVPEGPQVSFERSPTHGERLVSLILAKVPIPLPHPAWQFGCSLGGRLVIVLDDGSEIGYGPCRRPASINQLWGAMVEVISDMACRPHCGP